MKYSSSSLAPIFSSQTANHDTQQMNTTIHISYTIFSSYIKKANKLTVTVFSALINWQKKCVKCYNKTSRQKCVNYQNCVNVVLKGHFCGSIQHHLIFRGHI